MFVVQLSRYYNESVHSFCRNYQFLISFAVDVLSDCRSNENILYIFQKAIAQKEMAEFNQQLNSSPHDISLWLKFIDFTKNRDNSNNMQKSTDELDKQKPSEKVKFEIIMSIFDKALAKNPGNVKLEVSRIKHCEGYWDKEKQADTWKNLVFRHPNDAKLWWWFLQSQQHSLGGAGASGLVKLYGRCLVTLTSVLNGSLASHPPKPNALHSMSGKWIIARHKQIIFPLYCLFVCKEL